MIKHLLAIFFVLVSTNAFSAEEPDHVIHEELRGLLHGIEKAINSEKYADLEQYFDEKLRVTTINQEVILSRPGITTYFNKWFGPGGYLKKLQITLKPDALTELYGDKSFGIVRGAGEEKYVLSDGRHFDMSTRWTATVIKEPNGQWRILALHIGTNFLDNPILSKAEASLIYAGVGGLIVGIILGGAAIFIIMRRKKTSA